MSTLQMGSTGPAVSALQTQLTQAGEPCTADGDFGPATRSAVEQFQRSHGLTVDGVVGPQTSAALAKADGKQPAKPKPPSGGNGSGGAAPSGGTGGDAGKGGAVPDEVSRSQLFAIMPELTQARFNLYFDPLNRAMAEFSITNYMRKSAWLAQIAEESIDLLYFEEIASGWDYDITGPNPALARELGNTSPGDGPKYKGRGPIQLTGKTNYIDCGKALGIDLVDYPDLAATPNLGFRCSAWFWVSRGLNPLADAGNFEEITIRINGGLNGYSTRLQNYEVALRVMKA